MQQNYSRKSNFHSFAFSASYTLKTRCSWSPERFTYRHVCVASSKSCARIALSSANFPPLIELTTVGSCTNTHARAFNSTAHIRTISLYFACQLFDVRCGVCAITRQSITHRSNLSAEGVAASLQRKHIANYFNYALRCGNRRRTSNSEA